MRTRPCGSGTTSAVLSKAIGGSFAYLINPKQKNQHIHIMSFIDQLPLQRIDSTQMTD